MRSSFATIVFGNGVRKTILANCRADLMDKNREQELNANLLERRNEIMEQVQEYYEESDKMQELIDNKLHQYGKLQDDYHQIEDELVKR